MRPARSGRMEARRQLPGRPAPANSRRRERIALRVVGVPGIVCVQERELGNSSWVQYRGQNRDQMRSNSPRDASFEPKSICPRLPFGVSLSPNARNATHSGVAFPPVLHWSLASQTSWVRWFAFTALIQTSRPVFPFEGRSVGDCSCRASVVLRAGQISFPAAGTSLAPSI